MSAPQTGRNGQIIAWSLYDFANSAFTTLVVTFIYAKYFVQGIALDEHEGTRQWSLAVTVTAIVVALASPYLGAIADRGGLRKTMLFTATLVAVVGSFALFFPTAGEVWLALSIFAVANIAFEIANVFYNAYLPDIAPQPRIGRISGYGWAAGYVGGLICLVVALVGFVQPEEPWFGLTKTGGEHVRATTILVAIWYAAFSVPLFLWVRDRPGRPAETTAPVWRAATRQLATTFREIRRYRQVFRLLLARLIYNDGLVTIFAFGGIYAGVTFGFSFSEVIVFGIVLNVAAGIGAFAFGFLDDRVGGKQTILISLVGLFMASLLAVFAQSKALFWVAGIMVGILIGPNQSASRSLLGRFVPDDKENEFFGFYAFSGKATAFLGPLLLGQLTAMFQSQRAGISIVAVFFLIGALLLLQVNEAEGVARAGRGLAPAADMS
ncbi:MAG: MFS transporter [Gemmatimonadales bacterium]|nr:MFS transporter [Gemmatimonadales bacterium]